MPPLPHARHPYPSPQAQLTATNFSFTFAWWLLILLSLCACNALPTPSPSPDALSSRPAHPTLDDFWRGVAHFELEIVDTGLPMGESDTVIMPDGTWRSYVHASHQSLGVIDQCGARVEFPGCLVNFTSLDQGRTFTVTRRADGVPVCQMACNRCPCNSQRDHIDQQQYPRVARLHQPGEDDTWLMTYEYRANTIIRSSTDGLTWSSPAEVPLTGIWHNWLMSCSPTATIGAHPYTPPNYDCLVGSPPGIYIDAATTPPELYIFIGLGQNPSSMGCFRAPVHGPTSLLRACNHTPLFAGATEYGPLDTTSAAANQHFDFRTISSADLLTVGDRHYMFYEGVRGPGPGDQGDTQFLLGLARSKSHVIDGEWELFPGNPILLDLPGNVGVGHADVVVAEGATYLYTSLDGIQRSRLRLVWD